MPEGFRRTILIIMLVCALLVVAASYFIQSARTSGRLRQRSPAPKIPVYPGAISPQHVTANTLDWQRLIFKVAEDYPSMNVYDYYKKTLEAQGYRPARKEYVPKWRPGQVKDDIRKVVVYGAWVAPDGLRVLELEVAAREKLIRDPNTKKIIRLEMLPGLEVYCTLSRKIFI